MLLTSSPEFLLFILDKDIHFNENGQENKERTGVYFKFLLSISSGLALLQISAVMSCSIELRKNGRNTYLHRDKYSETKRIKVLCELLIISESPQLLREKRDTSS